MTHSRRQFLSSAAGLVIAATPALRAAKRDVRVGGRRVTVVDGHAHCAIPEVLEVVKGTEFERGVSASLNGPLVMKPDRLAAMDEQGIDVQVLSINPFWYGADRDLARRIIAVQNEHLAALCAAQPTRFVALASIALQHPDLAAEQLADAVATHRLRGAAIGGSVNGEELSSPKFEPFWAKAEQLGVVVFIHPQGIPDIRARVQGNGFLSNVIGNPLETTIALSHLIFEGTLDKFPGLKICAAHGGGFLPSYAGRSDQGCNVFPSRCTGGKEGPLKKKPTEYLKQMYYDNIIFTPEAMRHIIAEVGAGQILVGTDYPYPWTTTAADLVLQTPGLSDDERLAILGGTAAKLLGIKTA